MQKSFYVMMLFISISSDGFAQQIGATGANIFEQPTSVSRRFMIALDKGNKVQIELADIADLDHLNNIDSMFHLLIHDIELFKDSLSDEIASKRIDYVADPSGVNKIRIQQFRPKGYVYLVNKGDAASLKIEQDTINYIGSVYYQTKNETIRKNRYYRLSFFLNNINELPQYLNKSLQDKVDNLRQNINSKWVNSKDGEMHLKKDYAVSSKVHQGYLGSRDFVALTAGLDVQNYKKYFVPSFSVGAAVTFSNSYFKKYLGVFWEPQFLFAKNNQGNMQTYRNDFLTLVLAQGFIKDNDAKNESNFLSILSLGYMIRRSGDFYDKNSFRLGAGRVSLLEGKVKIEPAIYFHNFFKGVTPSLRVSVSF